MNRATTVSVLALALALAACDKPSSSAAAPEPAPKAAASPVVASAPPAPGSVTLAVAKAKGTFIIDAPLEKAKGGSDEGSGELRLDTTDLAKSRGEVSIKLTSLVTQTFGDKRQDDAQTGHARNWMEVGADSSAEKKAKFASAKLTITSVETATAKLADVKEEGGARTFKAKVGADLWIHGITSKKTVAVTVTVKGPPDAPTEVSVKTDEPMPVSMKEHEIMPRDGIGSFLSGALEKIGKKLDDKVQVSFEATATKR